jgi:hypothetical protein
MIRINKNTTTGVSYFFVKNSVLWYVDFGTLFEGEKKMCEKKPTQLDEFEEAFLQSLWKPEVLAKYRAEGKIPPAKVQHISEEVKRQLEEFYQRERDLRSFTKEKK